METYDIKHKMHGLASRIAEDEGFELVTVDILGKGKRMLVRVVIDKNEGVTVGDCERMSRDLGALLDVEDLIRGSYVLEVSSPGLDRPLTSQKDFERKIGKLVRVVTSEKIDNSTFFIGRLMDVGENWIRLKLQEKGGDKDIFIPMDVVSRARLEIEIK